MARDSHSPKIMPARLADFAGGVAFLRRDASDCPRLHAAVRQIFRHVRLPPFPLTRDGGQTVSDNSRQLSDLSEKLSDTRRRGGAWHAASPGWMRSHRICL